MGGWEADKHESPWLGTARSFVHCAGLQQVISRLFLALVSASKSLDVMTGENGVLCCFDTGLWSPLEMRGAENKKGVGMLRLCFCVCD